MTEAVAATPINMSPAAYANALTPDALMTYLSARLGGIDEQIQGIFSEQERADQIRQQLTHMREVLSTFKQKSDLGDKMEIPEDAVESLEAAIAELADLDPSMAEEIRTQLGEEGYVLKKEKQENGGNSNTKYSTREVQNTDQFLEGLTKDLESASQMNMIYLQSLMSGRQTAVSLSTNLLSKLSDSTQKIVENIR